MPGTPWCAFTSVTVAAVFDGCAYLGCSATPKPLLLDSRVQNGTSTVVSEQTIGHKLQRDRDHLPVSLSTDQLCCSLSQMPLVTAQ